METRACLFDNHGLVAMKRISIFFFFLFCILPIGAQLPGSEAAFKQLFDRAVAFADAYPREKAYLHFDNSSYYVGDTIWFKAYVTMAESHEPTLLSKPLYVEILNQSGHVYNRQVVELDKGEAHGQIILKDDMLCGYYEVRAYTRWMLAFGEPVYFSRTFPVYQKAMGKHPVRNIVTYDLNPSMKQRPKGVKESLALQLFPEGGSLVQGVASRVAFKAESRDEGEVTLTGMVCAKDGKELAKIETLHEGMGVFVYTPGSEPAVAKVTYREKEYTFDLPEALPTGYVLNVASSGGAIVGNLRCNAQTPAGDVAAFISREGRPYAYYVLPMTPGGEQTFLLKTKDLPGGIYQVSILNALGTTLCERFTFVQPNEKLSMQMAGMRDVYRPFEPVRCEIEVKDAEGKPLEGTFSVSIRDAVRSDYIENDHTLFTDMLLTSGLKGYIHQPGYYFTDITMRKLQELDALLMVHGWRQYDMSVLTASNPPELLQQPETDLILSGQLRSSVLKNEMKDMEVSVMVEDDGSLLTGKTVTDETGRFQIPVSNLDGEVEAVFQMRRKGSSRKKDALVMFDRNFSPDARLLGYEEVHPQWMDKNRWMALSAETDSLYIDSLAKAGNTIFLDEVEITKKRKDQNLTTQVFEQSVDAYYDVPRMVDEMRDKGEVVLTFPDFLSKVNPNFDYNRQDGACTYKNKTVCLIAGTEILDPRNAWALWNEVDGVRRIMICEGGGSFTNDVLASSQGVNHLTDRENEFPADEAEGELRSQPFSSMFTWGKNVGAEGSVGIGRSFDDTFYLYGDAAKLTMSGDPKAMKKAGEMLHRSGTMRYNINANIDIGHLDRYALFYVIPNEGVNIKDLKDKSMRAAHGTRRTFIQGYTRPLAFYSPAYKDKQPQDIMDDHRRTLYWNPEVRTDKDGKAIIECYNGMYSNPVIIQAEMLQDGIPCSMTWIGGQEKEAEQ